MGYILPQDRHQLTLFNFLDEVVGADHVVRLIDVLVDEIVAADPDFFLNRGLSREGRPAYHPSVFLKLYIYGYLNGVNSSRQLERECHRNLELMWLLGKLAPDFKTIADYRKDQREQIESMFLRMNLFLKDQGIIKGKVLSLDGTKVRAYASQSVSKARIEKLLAEEKAMLERYLAKLSAVDGEETALEEAEVRIEGALLEEESYLMRTLAETQEQIQSHETLLQDAEQTDQKRFCTTDPDARLMRGRQGTHWSYNVQANVDAAHGLIADIEATSSCNDRRELLPALERVEERAGIRPQTQLADTGYSHVEELLSVEQDGIECFIPNNPTRRRIDDQKHGLTFTYDPELDQYTCIEGKALHLVERNKRDNKRGTIANVYRAEDCRDCPLKSVCAPKANVARSVHRYHNHQARAAYRQKIQSDEGQKMKRLRSSLSEHPFGTLKRWMGALPLVLRGKQKVNTEIKLYATAYNLLRSVNICSVPEMIAKVKEYDWKEAINPAKGLSISKWKDCQWNLQHDIKFTPQKQIWLAA